MAFGVLSFLLLVQLPIIFASGLLEHSKACGTYHVSYSDDLHYELFYINGELVDKNVFCKSLIIDDTNSCFNSGNVGYQQCGLAVLLDTSDFASRRKFLLENAKEGSREHDSFENEADKNQRSQNTILTPKKLAIAAPLSLIFCCAIFCPCFRARRRGSSHYVRDNDPVSVDSSAPLELHSVHEKVPPSPLRVPPSPLRVPPSPSRFSMSPGLSRVGSVHLSMTQALRATQNFSSSLKIGEGGFGTVYKAHLPDGGFVAIKRAKKEHVDTLTSEFKSEVELLAKIEHRNLVRLLGYVDKGHERLIITEFVPNGTLREHLDGARGKILDFNQRLEISIDVAHALTYLHLYAGESVSLQNSFFRINFK
nr:calmodulin-binding receptor-like cytoplasmic kinase 3 [Ipomoea trifida]GMD80124.1 calmodulin-binding receptor-like cytoplasmic kinase 3 [Ipomoea batatas]